MAPNSGTPTHTLAYVDADALNPNLLCCICQTPFNEPVTALTCSHTFCRTCIHRALSISSQCPVDRSPLNADNLVLASHAIRNLVDELLVECPHRGEGCSHTCQRSLVDVHLRDSCGYVRVPCATGKCDSLILQKDEDTHDCASIPLCSDCGQPLKSDHPSTCGSVIIDCEACSSPFRRRDMAMHTAECGAVIVPCSQSSHGCPWTGPRAQLAHSHLAACPYEAMKGFFKLHDARLADLSDENVRLRQKISSLEGAVSVLQRESHAVRVALGPWYRPVFSTTTTTAPASAPSHRPASSQDGYPFPERAAAPSEISPAAGSADEQRIDQLFASLEPSSGPGDLPLPSPALATQGHPTPSSQHYQHHQQHPHLAFNPTHHTAPSAAPVAPLDLGASLEGTLAGLRASVVALGGTLDAVGRHAAIAQAADAARTGEELAALRAVVNALRMQVHSLIVHRNAQVTGRLVPGDDGQLPPPPPLDGAGGGGVLVGDELAPGWMQFGGPGMPSMMMPPPPPHHLGAPFPLSPRFFGPAPPGPRATKL